MSVTSRAPSPAQQFDDLLGSHARARGTASPEWEVRAVEAPERRELAVAELIHALRRAEVFEAVLPEVGQLDIDERRRRGRDEHLAAVACGGHSCRSVDVVADIALVTEERCSRVEAHTDPDGSVSGQAFGQLRRGRQSAGRSGERKEERVALRVHLHAATRRTRLANQPAVIGKCLGVGLRAQLVQQ